MCFNCLLTFLLQSNFSIIAQGPYARDMSSLACGVGSRLRDNADLTLFHGNCKFRLLLLRVLFAEIPLNEINGDSSSKIKISYL